MSLNISQYPQQQIHDTLKIRNDFRIQEGDWELMKRVRFYAIVAVTSIDSYHFEMTPRSRKTKYK